MAKYTDKKKIFYQNLKDAGCQKQMIEECLSLYEDGENKEVMKYLSIHRKSLLKNLHAVQYEIDCLDYLLNHLENEEVNYDL